MVRRLWFGIDTPVNQILDPEENKNNVTNEDLNAVLKMLKQHHKAYEHFERPDKLVDTKQIVLGKYKEGDSHAYVKTCGFLQGDEK